jgi:hypothetical protein
LFRSSARYTSLIIATPDHRIAVAIGQRNGVPHFDISVEWRSEPETERRIRQFFGARSLAPFQDYLAGNGRVPDATRVLSYYLPSDMQFITTIIKDALRELYQMCEHDALNFTYQEHRGAV